MEIGKLANVNEAAAIAPVSTLSPQEKVEQRQLIRAVQAVNSSHLFGESSELTFAYDRFTKKTVLRIVDKETKEVIRQLPPESVLRLAQELNAE